MFTGLSIRNFKNLAAVPSKEGELLPFGPLNVLIGPNGSGKSSLLQAIDFLRAFFRSSVEVYLQERGWDYRDLPNLRQTSKAIRWEIKAQLDPEEGGGGGGEYHYRVTLQPRKHLGLGEEQLRWRPSPQQEFVELLSRNGRRYRYLDRVADRIRVDSVASLPASIMSTWTTPRDRKRFPEALRFRDWVTGFRSYLIWDPKVLRAPSRGRHVELGQSGENLSSIIGHLKDTNRQGFERLVRRLRRLFPLLSDLSVSGRGWGWRNLGLAEANGPTTTYNCQQMSDGILRLVAVTSMLYLDRIPSVITFEEPENGVHPQLLREVVQILRELTQRKPPNRSQVFLTTHSPYVLDEFFDHPEEVYCMDRPAPQAGARIVRLSDNQQLNLARQSFDKSLGEAWVAGLIGATTRRREG